jgi:YegS/Rv2252/BmrU family lipid kinase
MKVRVIMHGRHEHSSRWLKNWRAWKSIADYDLSVVYTQYAGEAGKLSSKAVSDGVEVIVSAGGDGTHNECVNGYLKAKGQVPMTFLAMGTGNDFVKSLFQSGSWQEAHQLILKRKWNSIDIGTMKFLNPLGIEEERYFINVMDIGLGGEVVQKIAKSSRRWGSFLTYQKAVISSLLQYQKTTVDFRLDGADYSGVTLMLACANARWFGSGLGIAPMASLVDGKFTVVHIGEINLIDYLFQLPKVRRSVVLKHPRIQYFQAKEIAVDSIGLPVDCDGEFIGFTPIQCKMIPALLKVLVH